MMRARSIRFRLTLWYAAVLSVGLGLFGVLIWLSLRHQLIADIDRELEGRVDRFERFFRTESAEGKVKLAGELEEFCQALPPPSYFRVKGSSGFSFAYPGAGPEAAAKFRTLQRQFTIDVEVFDLEAGAGT